MANSYLASLPKSVAILGNAMLAEEAANKREYVDLSTAPSALIAKLAKIAGIPKNHWESVISKGERYLAEIEAHAEVAAASKVSCHIENGDEAEIVRQVRAVSKVVAACMRVRAKLVEAAKAA